MDWMQAQLSLSRGGLCLRSLSCHSAAAYLASLSSSGFDMSFNLHLSESIVLYNELVPAADSISEEILATSNLCQHTLSSKIEDQQFRQLFDLSTPVHLGNRHDLFASDIADQWCEFGGGNSKRA